MALVDVNGWGLSWPIVAGQSIAPAVGLGAATMDAADEKVAYLLSAPKAGTLKAVNFRFANVTQAPTNGLRVSIQALDTSGLPDGVQAFYRDVPVGSIVQNTSVTTGIISSDGTDTGALKTFTKNEQFAVVFDFVSIAASDSLQIARQIGDIFTGTSGNFLPTTTNFTTAWQTKNVGGPVNVGIQYSDDVWVPFDYAFPASASLAVNSTSSTTPDVYANKFVCPMNMRVDGFIAHIHLQSNASTFNFFLYDSNGTELATATPGDLDGFHSLNAGGVMRLQFAGDPVTLVSGSTYRVAVEATSTGQVRLHGYTAPSAAMLNAYPSGPNVVGSTRKDTGTWSDSTTNQYAIGVMITAIDVSAGGGSVIVRRLYED